MWVEHEWTGELSTWVGPYLAQRPGSLFHHTTIYFQLQQYCISRHTTMTQNYTQGGQPKSK